MALNVSSAHSLLSVLDLWRGTWVLLVLTATRLAAEPIQLVLDSECQGRTFEGIGALSAGASSRFLVEYEEPYRSQILDYLFKPCFGAGFQHLKVEIGGDVNSTDGCEPSHMHTRRDENYQRGYEWWLMREAKRRNPALYLDCLEWGAPAWIGNHNFFSQDNADYIARFIRGASTAHGLEINYVGVWNETRPTLGWIKRLRRTLDAQGLRSVQIVAADDIDRWNLVDVMQGDPELAAAIQVIGVHYPKYKSTPAAQYCGKPIWSSEDGPWKGNWSGATRLAQQFNRNYIEGKMTRTIIWSPVTAYYDNLPLPGSGVLKANTPWSGFYEVQPAVWATAHTTQFVQPGWKYLDDACQLLAGGGSCVGLLAEHSSDYSIVVETIDATNQLEVVFRIDGAVSRAPVHVWKSSAQEQFVRLDDLAPCDSKLTVRFEPGCIYSLTTTCGQHKGDATAAAPARFPIPYFESFDSYQSGATPKYFSDQAGVFEVARHGNGKSQCLRQILTTKGIEWPFHLSPLPETFLGDASWADYTVSTDVFIEKAGFVSLFGRVGAIPQSATPPNAYWLRVDETGEWELGTATAAIAAGRVPFSAGTWHRLGLGFAASTIQILVDDRIVRTVTDRTYPSGMIGLGGGWNEARFDNLAICAARSEMNLAFAARTTASSSAGPDHSPARATDGDAFTTRWTAAEGHNSDQWLEVDLGEPRRLSAVTFKSFEDRIGHYRIEHWSGQDWVDDYSGEKPGSAPKTVALPPVTAQRVRLLILDAKAPPSIWEFEMRDRALSREPKQTGPRPDRPTH